MSDSLLASDFRCSVQLREAGFSFAKLHRNLPPPSLIEAAIHRGEGELSATGALSVKTGKFTGRSPGDRYIVDDDFTHDSVDWGKINHPLSPDKFDRILNKMKSSLEGKEAFVFDGFVGAEKENRLSIRTITDSAWHNLFAMQIFIRPTPPELLRHDPSFTTLSMIDFQAFPEVDGTKSETFIIINLTKRLVLIGFTSYAGEIKKSMFSVMNYLLPLKGIFPMHCSANKGNDGMTALFFGLSGTGKTTLSADPERRLIGDDEHGWSDDGVFNIEGGCYAKVIKLSAEAEPDIYRTTEMFGTILENVVYDQTTRQIDLDDTRKTENTRASYPLTSIDNIVPEGRAGHPRNIIMLTADAFGVLPPVARLSPEQAMYHFLSGYTAKVAGTEKGIKEPQATFSTCFGAPFMVLHPGVYADLLGKHMAEHNAACWLVNTGWSGGPYGVGQRMKISYTRAMIRAILNGSLAQVETQPDPIFGVNIPVSCPEVPDEVLIPRNTWKDQEAYDRKARDLARRFNENFKKFAAGVSDAVRAVAPVAD